MKRLVWLASLSILPISIALGEQQPAGEQQPTGEKQPLYEKQPLNHSQDGVFGMYNVPKWYSYAITAANCYQAGKADISANSAQAISYFHLGLQYAHAAVAAGGGQSAESISQAISRELIIAENNLKTSTPTSTADNNDGNNSSNGPGASSQVQYQSHPSAPKANMTVQSGTGLSHTGNSQGGAGRQHT
jgi:hypothetical protein